MRTIILIILFFPFASLAQTGSEIYLFDLTLKNGKPVISNARNITNHIGYDNQPYFHPSKTVIYFSSFNDSGRSEIKSYNFSDNKTVQLTNTNEREYSPTVTPDGKFISCIIQRDNSAQDLGKYPIDGGQPMVVIDSRKVGYHVWIDDNNLLLFVLEDSGKNTLRYFNIVTKFNKILFNNPGRSLHKIPGTDDISFVHKESKEVWKIKRFNPNTHVVTDIATTISGKEDISWINSNMLITSDGTKLFYMDLKSEKSWLPVEMDKSLPELKGITRLAVNVAADKLAIVVAE